ncbi:phosphoketolase family protein [Methylobacterium oryzae CBMB20]
MIHLKVAEPPGRHRSVREPARTGGRHGRAARDAARGQDGGHADSRAAPAFVPGPLGPDGLRQIDAYRRAANYLSVGQIYLMANPLPA